MLSTSAYCIFGSVVYQPTRYLFEIKKWQILQTINPIQNFFLDTLYKQKHNTLAMLTWANRPYLTSLRHTAWSSLLQSQPGIFSSKAWNKVFRSECRYINLQLLRFPTETRSLQSIASKAFELIALRDSIAIPKRLSPFHPIVDTAFRLCDHQKLGRAWIRCHFAEVNK